MLILSCVLKYDYSTTISRTIALALDIDNRSPCLVYSFVSSVFSLLGHVSRVSLLVVSLAREGVPGNAVISRCNSSLVRSRIIARVNGSFFSVRAYEVASRHGDYTCVPVDGSAIVSFSFARPIYYSRSKRDTKLRNYFEVELSVILSVITLS